ncbi:MAG: ABC transporter substrate-binding protein [Desulfohalobiaceae bacterium]|nr:ABC transporter substrate-binding protein [Desulfohalobiaceae bacterium]
MLKKIIIPLVIVVGCFAFVASPAFAAKDPIKIGSLFVMTGKLGGYGKSGWQAAQLAIDEINANGGILSRQLEATVEDTNVKPENGMRIAKKYILRDKVDFILGPTASSVGLAVSDVCKRYKTIHLNTQSATDVMTGEKFHPYVFSILSNTVLHSRSGAYYAANMPYKTWMGLNPDYSYGHSSMEMFKEKMKELRPDSEFKDELYPKLMTNDFTPYINKILQEKPDAVWSSLWGGDAVTFIKQAIKFDLFEKVKFFFPVGASQEVLTPLGKDMPEDIYMSARYFFTQPDSPLNRAFVKAYHDRYDEYPSYMAEETYAALYFLKAACERAGTTETEAVIKAVEQSPLAWETPEGWKIMGKDHQVVEDVVWGETTYSDEYGFAILKNVASIQAEQICRTPDEVRQILENYEKNK